MRMGGVADCGAGGRRDRGGYPGAGSGGNGGGQPVHGAGWRVLAGQRAHGGGGDAGAVDGAEHGDAGGGADLAQRVRQSGGSGSADSTGTTLANAGCSAMSTTWSAEAGGLKIKPRLAEIGDNGNSHSRRLPSYERMLAAYTPIYEQIAKGSRRVRPRRRIADRR